MDGFGFEFVWRLAFGVWGLGFKGATLRAWRLHTIGTIISLEATTLRRLPASLPMRRKSGRFVSWEMLRGDFSKSYGVFLLGR